jgi:hypothetical protein
MPKYQVLKKSFIGNRVVEAGETIDFDGQPSDNLKAVADEKKHAARKSAEKPAEEAAAEQD